MDNHQIFQKLRAHYLVPQDKIASISYRYHLITKRLNRDFYGSDSETAHSRYLGSYGRDTDINKFSDLDIAFILPNKKYEQYHNYIWNGQSELLQEVKRSLQNTYSSSHIRGDGQVVQIHFTDGMTFEILPCFKRDDGSFLYPDTHNGGSWKDCNPLAEQDSINLLNKRTDGYLKAVCRMTRVWNENCNVQMSGMLIDTLAYNFISRLNSFYGYHLELFHDFMKFLSEQRFCSYYKAPGSGDKVEIKADFCKKAATAYNNAHQALDMTHTDRAPILWSNIFGDVFLK